MSGYQGPWGEEWEARPRDPQCWPQPHSQLYSPTFFPQALQLKTAMDQVGVGWGSEGVQGGARVPHLLPVSPPGVGAGVKPQKPGEPHLSLFLSTSPKP